MIETTPPAPSHLPPPRWFKLLSGWGLRLLKPILPERWLHWLEHAAWFIAVGAFNTALSYVMFIFALNVFDLARGWALLLSYALGMVISYQTFSRLVFLRGKKLAWARFVPASLTLYLMNKGLLDVLVWESGLSEELSQFLLLPVVAGLSYLINRFFVFCR